MIFWSSYDKQNAESLARIAEALAGIAASLYDIRFLSSRPGNLSFVQLEKKMSKISFKVLLPTLVDEAGDVVRRELSTQIGGGEPVVELLPKDAAESDVYAGDQDSPVRLSLVDIDDAGNRSEASVLDAVLLDTFPPAKPGELSIVETGETA